MIDVRNVRDITLGCVAAKVSLLVEETSKVPSTFAVLHVWQGRTAVARFLCFEKPKDDEPSDT
jgi:hypothetical protein